MKLFFLYGLPGTGKLTIARELAELTGIKLFHNHLTVDLLLSVFEFGSAPFVELRERIWLSVFEEATALPAMIFTFNPENSVRQSFIQKTVETIESRDGEVFFVEVVCDPAEETCFARIISGVANAGRFRFSKDAQTAPDVEQHADVSKGKCANDCGAIFSIARRKARRGFLIHFPSHGATKAGPAFFKRRELARTDCT